MQSTLEMFAIFIMFNCNHSCYSQKSILFCTFQLPGVPSLAPAIDPDPPSPS